MSPCCVPSPSHPCFPRISPVGSSPPLSHVPLMLSLPSPVCLSLPRVQSGISSVWAGKGTPLYPPLLLHCCCRCWRGSTGLLGSLGPPGSSCCCCGHPSALCCCTPCHAPCCSHPSFCHCCHTALCWGECRGCGCWWAACRGGGAEGDGGDWRGLSLTMWPPWGVRGMEGTREARP